LRANTASCPSVTSLARTRATIVTLVSSASQIRSSVHPSPPSPWSALSRMRAFRMAFAELLPLEIISLSRARSSALSSTTYRLFATLRLHVGCLRQNKNQ
jgi:hypothetical protein